MRSLFVTAGLGILLILAGLYWYTANERGTKEGVESAPLEEGEEGTAPLPIVLANRTVRAEDGEELSFRLPEDFHIGIAAEGLGKARFMAMSPDNRLFVPDMVDYLLSHEGKLYILDDWNDATGRFETRHEYLSNLRGPNSVAFYTDKQGKTWLYLALTEHLLRYPYKAGDLRPSGDPEIVTTFPNAQTPGETSVVWHITRTAFFHDDRLYVGIGSGCNSCEQPEGEKRAMILAMDPDGSNLTVYADGIRNPVGLAWAKEALFATGNGGDHLGADRPNEMLYQIEEGKHYGWPYCYELEGEILPDTSSFWPTAFSCEDVPKTFAAFSPHSAPLGITFFEKAHPVLQDTFLVALHGSFDPQLRRGYEIVRVTTEGEVETFIGGFQKEDASRIARPVTILQKDRDSFFFTDDLGGKIFLVSAR